MAHIGYLVDIELATLRLADRLLIKDFTLQIEQGSRIGLTGPSGCGKTTLLRSIASRRPTLGVTARNFRITNDRIGYIPQRSGMLPWYSVERNLLAFAPEESRKSEWCDEVLDFMELTHVRSTFPGQLSGGELQRSRLACAIATQPILYCADEPLTEVGLQQKWRLLERWSVKMNECATGLLLVSHDIDTLLYLCDKVVVLGGPEPTQMITQVHLPGPPHPRRPQDLNNNTLVAARRSLTSVLYSGETLEYQQIPTQADLSP